MIYSKSMLKILMNSNNKNIETIFQTALSLQEVLLSRDTQTI
jgi:hypothetical protein